jgi:hypothetical protein
MDGDRFDAAVHWLGTRLTRRTVGLMSVGMTGAAIAGQAEAKKRKKHKNKDKGPQRCQAGFSCQDAATDCCSATTGLICAPMRQEISCQSPAVACCLPSGSSGCTSACDCCVDPTRPFLGVSCNLGLCDVRYDD